MWLKCVSLKINRLKVNKRSWTYSMNHIVCVSDDQIKHLKCFKLKSRLKAQQSVTWSDNRDEGHIFFLLSCFLSLNLYCFYLMIWFDALVFGLVVSHFILVYSSSCVMISFHFLPFFLCIEACVFPSLVFFSLTLVFACGLFRLRLQPFCILDFAFGSSFVILGWLVVSNIVHMYYIQQGSLHVFIVIVGLYGWAFPLFCRVCRHMTCQVISLYRCL